MKKGLFLSTALALILSSSVSAEALKDSVAKKEANVISKPTVVNTKDAKSEEKKLNLKELKKAKKDAIIFQKEANSDKAKRITNIVNKEIKYQQGKMQKAPKEIALGLKYTTEALYLLYKNDTKKAQEALTKADKYFDTALKANPNLKLVPIAEDIHIVSIEAPLTEIKDIIKTSKKLLDEDRVQESKALLAPLSDEIDIETMSIPMELYPLATKTALAELKQDNKKAAFLTLEAAANTLVHTKVTIPLGLIIAQDYVIQASHIDKSKKKEALALLDIAKYELQKARLLGYTTKHDKSYKSLQDQIDAIQKEIKGKNKVEKLYSKIKSDFTSLLNKTRKDVDIIGTPAQQKAEKKVVKFENTQQKRAIKESKEFLEQAKKDLNTTAR